MQENHDKQQLAYAVIAEVTTRVSSLLSQSLSAGVDKQKRSNLEIRARFVLARSGSNNSIQIEVKTESAEGTIGIWLGSETTDISIWSIDTSESLYEFHGYYANVDVIKQHLEKVVEILVT